MNKTMNFDLVFKVSDYSMYDSGCVKSRKKQFVQDMRYMQVDQI